MDHVREVLKVDLRLAAELRRQKAAECPDDHRNLIAVIDCERLLEELDRVAAGRQLARIQTAWDSCDDKLDLADANSEFFSELGGCARYANVERMLDALAERLEDTL